MKRVAKAIKLETKPVVIEKLPEFGNASKFKTLVLQSMHQVRTVVCGSELCPTLKEKRMLTKKSQMVQKKPLHSEVAKPKLDFPQLLNVLPSDIQASSLLDFPLLNPWRLSNFKTPLTETEVEAQNKRAQLLASSFPVSKFPSVSKILQGSQSSMSKEHLERWKASKIEEMGEVAFIDYQRKLFGRGAILHRYIAERLQANKIPTNVAQEVEGFWTSLQPVFSDISDVKVIEKHITHPFLCYKGVVDCVASYKNELVLIDWKTSSKPKPSLSYLYDEPLQAVAYLGALNYDKNFDYQLERIALIIAYEDGEPAEVHHLSHSHCRDYWKLFLGRLKTYWDATQRMA
jgi:genome maintenance exonuclease 1